jgi:hypothetical protein
MADKSELALAESKPHALQHLAHLLGVGQSVCSIRRRNVGSVKMGVKLGDDGKQPIGHLLPPRYLSLGCGGRDLQGLRLFGVGSGNARATTASMPPQSCQC